MTERTLSGRKKPRVRSPWGARRPGPAASRRGSRPGVAGPGRLAALPWALGLLGASAVLAAAAVFAH